LLLAVKELIPAWLTQDYTVTTLDPFKHTFSHFHLVIKPVLLEFQCIDNGIDESIGNAINTKTDTRIGGKNPMRVASSKIGHQINEHNQRWFDVHKPSKIGLSAPTVKILERLKR